jgi:hypothetical protein
MAGGMLGGLVGGEDEKPDVRAPEALAGAEEKLKYAPNWKDLKTAREALAKQTYCLGRPAARGSLGKARQFSTNDKTRITSFGLSALKRYQAAN